MATIIIICIGFIALIFGWAVSRNPTLIAGYNSLSKNKKQKINIDAYSKMLRKNIVILGITAILSTIFLKLSDLESFQIPVAFFLILVGISYIGYQAKYN